MTGKLREGVTATDLVLTVVELLRKTGVVGKFIEYYGEGAEALALPDRATIANMAPEYGATMGFFPVDGETLRYYRLTGRSEEQVEVIRSYFTAQGLFGIPKSGEVEYSQVIEIDLDSIEPCLAGPRLPQERRSLSNLKSTFEESLTRPVEEGERNLRDGDVVVAAITSCTNTSNPVVMLGAGLLARKAVEKGLRVPSYVKTCREGPCVCQCAEWQPELRSAGPSGC
jgi:aconitate hydratase